MRSAYRSAYGSPSVLEVRELDIPPLGPRDILVRVRAATVNRTDCGALYGEPYIFRFFVGWPRPREVATGTDFAGEVIAVGEEVTLFSVGERVMGFDDNNLGSHAEYLVLSEERPIARIPEGIGFEVAAASLEGAHYAFTFLQEVPLAAGQKVLVYGATGAIGSASVQLLHDAGIEVTAVCATEHHEAIRTRGAKRLLDHRGSDWTQALAGERFACVLDAVGKSTFGVCRAFLEPKGVYLSSELGPGAQNIWYALVAPLMRGPKVRFPLPKDIPRSLGHIVPLVAQGKFQPLIDRSYPLEKIREAFEYVRSGQKIGNVLLTFD